MSERAAAEYLQLNEEDLEIEINHATERIIQEAVNYFAKRTPKAHLEHARQPDFGNTDTLEGKFAWLTHAYFKYRNRKYFRE